MPSVRMAIAANPGLRASEAAEGADPEWMSSAASEKPAIRDVPRQHQNAQGVSSMAGGRVMGAVVRIRAVKSRGRDLGRAGPSRDPRVKGEGRSWKPTPLGSWKLGVRS